MPHSHSPHLKQVVELLRAALQGSSKELFADVKGWSKPGHTSEPSAPQGRWIEMAKHSETPSRVGASAGRWGGTLPDMSDWKDDELSSASAAMFLDPNFPCGDPLATGRRRKRSR